MNAAKVGDSFPNAAKRSCACPLWQPSHFQKKAQGLQRLRGAAKHEVKYVSAYTCRRMQAQWVVSDDGIHHCRRVNGRPC